MTENKKMIPETTENTPLTDDELDKVSGGDKKSNRNLPMFTRCSVDPSHVYDPQIYSACPICEAK